MSAPREGIVVSAIPQGFCARGDVLTLNGATHLRVQEVGATVLTVRHVHASRLLEWLHAHLELWVLWPLKDMRGLFG